MSTEGNIPLARRATTGSGRGVHRARGRAPSVADMRALRAVVLIVGLLSVLAVANLITQDAPSAPAYAGRSLTDAMLTSVQTGEDIVADDETLPSWFEEEFFPVEGYFDLHGNEDGTVMSLTSALPAATTLSHITAAMETKGWEAIASGNASMVTMVKTEGSHTWALIWGQDVGGQSTIVVQTLPCD